MGYFFGQFGLAGQDSRLREALLSLCYTPVPLFEVLCSALGHDMDLLKLVLRRVTRPVEHLPHKDRLRVLKLFGREIF